MTTSTAPALHDQVTSFVDELEHHKVYTNDYFKYLEETQWNSRTYDFHRANFFHRTEGTVKGIATCAPRPPPTTTVTP